MNPGDLLYHLTEQVDAADKRIRPFARETPVEEAVAWSADWGCRVWLKLENHQVTGSFKFRGALNRLLTLPVSQRAMGVVAASTGNHGLAVAQAARGLNIPCTVYVPQGASPAKLAAIESLGAELLTHGTDGVEAEIEARGVANESGRVYVSPYNDDQVVAGQGTVGAELTRQLDRTDVLVVAVGGGGLISGVAGYLRATGREIAVIGASPEASAAMAASVRSGEIVNVPHRPTLSDGTAGGIESDAITFPLCRTLVDEWVLISEEEIAATIRDGLDSARHLMEGAAAVAVAAARRVAPRFPKANMVVVVCGGNIGTAALRTVIGKGAT